MVAIKRSTPLYLILVAFLTCARAQEVYQAPISPLSPNTESDCAQVTDQYQNDLSQISSTHQACLDAHPKQDNPGLPFDSPTCSVNACQSLHTKMLEVKAAGPSVNVNYNACMSRLDQQRQYDQQRESMEEHERERREEMQRQHDEQIRAAQQRTQEILDNSNRAQSAIADAFGQVRATLQAQADERSARENQRRLQKEEIDREQDEQQQRDELARQQDERLREQQAEAFHQQIVEEFNRNRDSDQSEPPSKPLGNLSPLLPTDPAGASASESNSDTFASLFRGHDPETAEESPAMDKALSIGAGLFDDAREEKIKTPLDAAKSFVRSWIDDLEEKAGDNTAAYFFTGKSLSRLPEQFQKDYAVWRAGFDRVREPLSLQSGFEFVNSFGELFDLWNER